MARIWIVTLTLFVVSAATACAGKPAVPDEQQQRDYASTEAEESETDSSAQEKPKTGEMTQVDPNAEPIKATGPVATVNGTPIPAADFNLEIERVVASGMPPALLGQFRDQIVEKLVDRRLIEGAIEKGDIEVADSEIDAKMDEVKEEFARASQQYGEQASLEALTAQLGISAEELRESLEQAIAIEKLLEKRGLETPDEAKVKEFYEQNKEQFKRPEQVHARHILISVEKKDDAAAWDAAEKRAAMVRAEAVKEGTDFAALAKEKSDGPSAESGGDLGFFGRGQMVPEFEEAAFGMAKGEVSEPVKTQFGWHIIKVDEKREAGVVPFEEIDEELTAQMKNQAVQEALVGFLDELRKDATVEMHPENIE